MTNAQAVRGAARFIAGGAAVAAAAYAATATLAYARYGHPARPRTRQDEDSLLDHFMPLYDVVERHHIHVAAPAGLTLDVARDLNLLDSSIVRAIFKGREWILRASPPPAVQLPKGLLASVQSMGWGVLADIRGREVVVGAVTRPWEPDVVFQRVDPDAFEAFAEPDYVKIAWTLRADPVGDDACVFRTETRAVATDNMSRRKFRRYWAVFSPGIALIRRLSLQPVKCVAERRQSASREVPASTAAAALEPTVAMDE
jgi:hypothetical protein